MKLRIFALTVLVTLGGCGSGSMSGGSNAAGNGVAVATSGVITAFGSVYVNGVRYDVSAAQIQKNGNAVTQAALSVGEVAMVQGVQLATAGQGRADSVDVEDSVVGPAANINVAANTLDVLGQHVAVTATTSFGSSISTSTLAGLTSGTVVEVSGLMDTTGTILATRIAPAESGESLQVLGLVSGLDAGAHTFMINGLTVDFSAAALTGFATGQPADGDLVVVRGALFDATAVKFTATAVRRAASETSEAPAGARIEREGLITRFSSATDFDVGGVPVTTTSATVVNGGALTDLALNVQVEVRGALNASGVLVADSISIDHVAVMALAGAVSAVTATTLTVLGVTVTVDGNTRFEDKSSAQVQMFTLSSINVGDTVLVRGYESPAGSGTVLAVRLERLPPSTTALVRGPFTATTAPQFKILGLVVDTSNATFSAEQTHHTETSAQFFAAAPGQIVAATGTFAGSVLMATSVQIDTIENR